MLDAFNNFVDVIYTCTPKLVDANFMVTYQLPSVYRLYMMFTFYSDEEDFLEDDFLDTLVLWWSLWREDKH